MTKVTISACLKENPAMLPPPLKWAGGKRWLVPFLQALLQERLKDFPYRRLVEPFCGGLAVALGLKPKNALLNDINPHVINFYSELQKGFSSRETFKNDETSYYQIRKRFNALITKGKINTPEAAACFYYLNRTGYNGLCRFNKEGLFNVPFGRYKAITYQQDFRAYQALLSSWAFCWGDFETLLCRENDIIYADPPYDVPFVTYAKEGFHWDDQVRLAQWLAAQPCPVIASNQATPRILALYEDYGFELRCLDAPRRISCTGDRTPVREMLALRNFGAGVECQ